MYGHYVCMITTVLGTVQVLLLSWQMKKIERCIIGECFNRLVPEAEKVRL